MSIIPSWIIIYLLIISYDIFMKKIIMAIIVFLLCISFVYAEDDLSIDDFACSYYEEVLQQIDLLIEEENYVEAQKEIEKLYNSKCRTKEVAERYVKVLYEEDKLHEAYKIASDNLLLDTQMGLLLQTKMLIGTKDVTIARSIYDNIVIKNTYDKIIQMGLSNNVISSNSYLEALKELENIPSTPESQFLKAKAFYNMEMYEDAKKILDDLPPNNNVAELKELIKEKRAYQISTGYEIYLQKLNEEFKLDANKIAFSNSCYANNMQVYLDYVLYLYKSGVLAGQGPEPLYNLTNEIRIGTQGRLNKKVALKGDIGAKFFQDYGIMLLTDSWIKYYVNDNFNVKLGFSRNNAEQTFLSAVGVKIDNIFTGQVANNNLYLDTNTRLPHQFYLYTKGGVGLKDGYNLPNNGYWEGMLGFGKVLRFDLDRPYLQKISLDFVSYNSGYQTTLENIYSSQGLLYGGYFSPKFYSDDTINISLSGRYKKSNLYYGYGAFSGWQFAYNPDQSIYIWGGSVYLKYLFNKHFALDTQYRYYRYANINKNQFLLNLVITLFRDKNKIAKK